MPGMTATVSLVVNKRDDVLRIPASALRFRPPEGVASPSPGGTRPSAGAGTAQAADRLAAGGRRRPRGSDAPPGAGAAEQGRPATVYLPGKDGPQAQRIRVGLSDGQFVQVLGGLEEGTQVITGLDNAARAPARPGATPSSNPFAPGGRGQRRQR
jgi:HlyD family secretion protein